MHVESMPRAHPTSHNLPATELLSVGYSMYLFVLEGSQRGAVLALAIVH